MASEVALSRDRQASEKQLVFQVILWVGVLLAAAGAAASVFVREYVLLRTIAFCLGLAVAAPPASVLYTPHLFTIIRRELGAYFLSPIAYMVLTGMTLIAGWNFLELVAELRLPRVTFAGIEDPILNYMGQNIWLLFALLAVPGIVTMRLFSEERRSGTIETLLTVPVTDTEVVLGKYIAALAFYMTLWVPWGLFLIGLYFALEEPFDLGPVLSIYLCLFVLGTGFVAGGLLFSSLTKNQITSFILTFAFMVLFLAIVVMRYFVEEFGFGQEWVNALQFLSFWIHLRDFGLGKVDIRYIVLHFSIAVFLLYATVKVLESQKWR